MNIKGLIERIIFYLENILGIIASKIVGIINAINVPIETIVISV